MGLGLLDLDGRPRGGARGDAGVAPPWGCPRTAAVAVASTAATATAAAEPCLHTPVLPLPTERTLHVVVEDYHGCQLTSIVRPEKYLKRNPIPLYLRLYNVYALL